MSYQTKNPKFESLALPSLTENSIMLIGASGVVTEDNLIYANNKIELTSESVTGFASLNIKDSLGATAVEFAYSETVDTVFALCEAANFEILNTGAGDLTVQADNGDTYLTSVLAAATAVTVGASSVDFVPTSTTGNGLYVSSDALTTGKLAHFYSNGVDTTSRDLVTIHNDNPLATGVTALNVRNDSTGRALNVAFGTKTMFYIGSGDDVWNGQSEPGKSFRFETADVNTALMVLADGKVSVGSASALLDFTVAGGVDDVQAAFGSATGNTNSQIQITDNSDGRAAGAGRMVLGYRQGSGQLPVDASLSAQMYTDGDGDLCLSTRTSIASEMRFYTCGDGSTASQRMVIASAGNVGIATNTPAVTFEVNGVARCKFLQMLDGAAAPSTVAGVASLYVDNADNKLKLKGGDGTVSTLTPNVGFRSYCVADIGTAGVKYYGGFYKCPATSVTLTIGGTVTQNIGSIGKIRGAHVLCVASGPAAVRHALTVTGISVTDAGVLTAGDSEVLVATTDTATTNQKYESVKKWVGQVVYTLTGTSGSFTFNYGWAGYDDLGNRDYTITDILFEGIAGANETALNCELIPHIATGWTYHATAFVPGSAPVCSLLVDYTATNDNLTTGEQFMWKRANLSQAIEGSAMEGHLVRVSTATNNSISSATISLIVTF